MISACKGASASPIGGGICLISRSSRSFTPRPVLALTSHGVAGLDADYFLDLLLDARRFGGRQIDLVQHRHHFQTLLDRGVAVGDALRLDALRGVDHQQRALTGRQRPRHLVGKVHVAGGVDEIERVGLAVLGFVGQRNALRLDGDPALALEVHRVQHLFRHFAVGQAAADLNEAVGQRRLAVVDVRDDRKITDVREVGHAISGAFERRSAPSAPTATDPAPWTETARESIKKRLESIRR